MSKNRKFQMFLTIVLIVSAFIATISAAGAPAMSNADPALPVILHVKDADGLSDYRDYYQRHSESRDASGWSVASVEDRAPLDECFDVSISELAACREASTLPSP